MSHVHTNSGISINFIPGVRRLKMVTITLMEPSTEEMPIMWTPKMKKSVLSGP